MTAKKGLNMMQEGLFSIFVIILIVPVTVVCLPLWLIGYIKVRLFGPHYPDSFVEPFPQHELEP